jgi:polyhydroxyalkanoate synthase
MSAFASLQILNPKKRKANRFRAGRLRPYRRRDQFAGQEKAQLLGQRWRRAKDAESWLAGAQEHAGSWWPEWAGFLAANGGKDVKAQGPSWATPNTRPSNRLRDVM